MMDRKHPLNTLGAVLSWLRSLPPGCLIPASALIERLQDAAVDEFEPISTPGPILPPNAAFWTYPPDTRLTVVQLALALNRPKSWVYRRTSRKSGLPRLPHRRLDGGLSFLAGEVRAYVLEHEVRG
jgi:hypothetical protein